MTSKFDAELYKVVKKKSIAGEFEDSLIKHAVKWQLKFNVNKCSKVHGGAMLYNYQLLPFLESNFGGDNRSMKTLASVISSYQRGKQY